MSARCCTVCPAKAELVELHTDTVRWTECPACRQWYDVKIASDPKPSTHSTPQTIAPKRGRICARCDGEIDGRAPSAYYCTPCRDDRKRERRRAKKAYRSSWPDIQPTPPVVGAHGLGFMENGGKRVPRRKRDDDNGRDEGRRLWARQWASGSEVFQILRHR